jgi:isoleucyl-tRNA synthetase
MIFCFSRCITEGMMWRSTGNKLIHLSRQLTISSRFKWPLIAVRRDASSTLVNQIEFLQSRRLATQIKVKSKKGGKAKTKAADKYAHTLQLPRSDAPFIEPAKDYEHRILTSNQSQTTYDEQSRDRADRKSFTLLDGPPYANGPLHIGHAINKILKDVFVRHHYQLGNRVHFRPGWDCHGLPIELKALQHDESFRRPVDFVRTKAEQFARHAQQQQAASFTRWNLLADLANPYVTCSTDFVVSELKALLQMYEKGLIFKRRLPIYWSPSARTALAESELEYNSEHQGHSVYVGFALDTSTLVAALDLTGSIGTVHALIWTTTPWTLPANQAIAFAPELKYSLVRIAGHGDKHFVIASQSVQHLMQQLNANIETIQEFYGQKLHNLTYTHPLNRRRLPLIASDLIESGKGTGLVHTAPNHGQDDFVVCRKNGIEPDVGLVNELGEYNENVKGTLPDEAVGLPVINQGSHYVIKQLNDHVIKSEAYVHNYPYDWRTKQPVITMATCQFFLDIEPIREECLNSIDTINFIPNIFANKLKQNIVQRPQWCISRQRCWGVPIPAIYSKSDDQKLNPIINQHLIHRTIDLIESDGLNSWWTLPIETLLTDNVMKQAQLSGCASDYVKGTDILDVWFDSGVAFNHVLGKEQADLVVEGQDQLRGWFLSTLICSVALNRRPACKNIFVHGFAVDKDFKKMSKSLGNVLDPSDVVDGRIGLGADVLRLWVAVYANSHVNVATREEQFDKCNEMLQKIRRTIRFCSANLFDVDAPQPNSDALDTLSPTDRFYLHRLNHYDDEMKQAYANFDLNVVMSKSFDFIDQLSSEYFSSVKDTLYNDPATCPARRAVQTVLWHTRNVLHRHLWPICPMLIERLQEFDPITESNASSSTVAHWNAPKLAEQFHLLSKLREQLHSALNGESVLIKYDLVLSTEHAIAAETLSNLLQQDRILVDYWQVASISLLAPGSDLNSLEDYKHITLQHEDVLVDAYARLSSKSRCKRCRKFACDANQSICTRCYQVLADHFPDMPTV